MDGLVPDVSGGSMQSATVGSLLGQLSVEERLAVVVGLLKYIEPQPSQQASKAMSIVEALMADKPSTELVALMGPSDASRLQQMTPPAEVKKETRDFGVQVEPPPTILPPPRTLQDRAAWTITPPERANATSQTDTRHLVDRALSPVPQTSLPTTTSRQPMHENGVDPILALEVIDVDDEEQLIALSRKLAVGRHPSFASELIVELELKKMSKLFDAATHNSPSDERRNESKASASATAAPSPLAGKQAARAQTSDVMQVDELSPSPPMPVQAPEPTRVPTESPRILALAARKRKRAQAQLAVPATGTAGAAAPAAKRIRPENANPLKRKRGVGTTVVSAREGSGAVDAEAPADEDSDIDAPTKPKPKKRAKSKARAGSDIDDDTEWRPFSSVRVPPRESGSQRRQSAAEVSLPQNQQKKKAKGGWPKGRPRKPQLPADASAPDVETVPAAEPTPMTGKSVKHTYSRRQSRVHEDEDIPERAALPVIERRVSPPSPPLSQEDQDAQDAAEGLATLSTGGRPNGHGSLDTSALDQLALAAQQEDERRSRSPRSPQEQVAQLSQPYAQAQEQLASSTRTPIITSSPLSEDSTLPEPSGREATFERRSQSPLAARGPFVRAAVNSADGPNPPSPQRRENTLRHSSSPPPPARERLPRALAAKSLLPPQLEPVAQEEDALRRSASPQPPTQSVPDADVIPASTPRINDPQHPALAQVENSRERLLQPLAARLQSPGPLSPRWTPASTQQDDRRSPTPAPPTETPVSPVSPSGMLSSQEDDDAMHVDAILSSLPTTQPAATPPPAAPTNEDRVSEGAPARNQQSAIGPQTAFAPVLPEGIPQMQLLRTHAPAAPQLPLSLRGLEDKENTRSLSPAASTRPNITGADSPPKDSESHHAPQEITPGAAVEPLSPLTQLSSEPTAETAPRARGESAVPAEEPTPVEEPAPATRGRGRGRGRGARAGAPGPGRGRGRGRGGGRGRGRGKPIPLNPFLRQPAPTSGDDDTESEDDGPGPAGPSTAAAGHTPRLPPATRQRLAPTPKRSSSLPAPSSDAPLSPSSQLDILDDRIRASRQQPRAGTPFATRERDSPFPPEAAQDRSGALRFRLPALPKSQPGAPYKISANPVPELPLPPPGPSGQPSHMKDQVAATAFRDAVTNLRRADSGSGSATASRESSVNRSFGSAAIGQGARRRVSFLVPDGYDKDG